MRSLIVPCAGKRKINDIPLFLNCYPDGKIVGAKAIEGAFPEKYDRVIFTILQEDEEKFNAIERLRTETESLNPEFVILKEETSGPADTIYQTIIEAKIKGEFAVRDSHAFLKLKDDCHGNFVAGLDLTQYNKTIDNLRSKSFISVNEQGRILDIVEKHFSSDIISAGMYGFKSVEDFLSAYKRLKDDSYSIDKLYLSHIISYLIGYKERIFHCIEVDDFEDWATVSAWNAVQNNHSLNFLNLDEVRVDDEIKKLLLGMNEIGKEFIGFTNNSDCDEYSGLLESGIIKAVISNCSKTTKINIINSVKQLENISIL